MNAVDKQKQQRIIQVILTGIDSKVKDAVTKKDNFRAVLNNLITNGPKTYNQEYVEKETERVNANFSSEIQAVGKRIVESLEEVRKLINERDSQVDLDNPALSNALMLINNSGNNLEPENIDLINKAFAFDQTSLRMLLSAYRARGIEDQKSNVITMIYNSNEAIDNLIEIVNEQFTPEGSINYFADKFAKFAVFEGLEFEKTPDNKGFIEKVYRAAGIKANSEF